MTAVAIDRTFTYDPSVFDVESLEHAKNVILTPEGGVTVEQRWRLEAPWIMSLIEQKLDPKDDTVWLDYGCGVGRIARPLIHKHGGKIVGADISPNMRGLAASLVEHDYFLAVSPSALDMFGSQWADHCLCIWTLQHVLDPKEAVEHIANALKPGGKLLLINNSKKRAVPITHRDVWADDQIKVHDLVAQRFDLIKSGGLPVEVSSAKLAEYTGWSIYEKMP